MKVEMLEDYVMLVFLFVFCMNSSVLLVCVCYVQNYTVLLVCVCYENQLLVCVCYVQNSTVLFVFCMSFCLECNGSDLW